MASLEDFLQEIILRKSMEGFVKQSLKIPGAIFKKVTKASSGGVFG